MEGGARAERRHEGQEKSFEGKEAAFRLPRTAEGQAQDRIHRNAAHTPPRAPPQRGARAANRVDRAHAPRGCGGEKLLREGARPRSGRREVWPVRQRPERDLGSENRVAVDSVFNLWSRGC